MASETIASDALSNVLNRVIKPALNRCEACGERKTDHVRADHAFKRDARYPEATNLHDLGVDDKAIQAIVRHSDVSVTQRCYIKTLPAQSAAAMNALESALCAERALGTAVLESDVVNQTLSTQPFVAP